MENLEPVIKVIEEQIRAVGEKIKVLAFSGESASGEFLVLREELYRLRRAWDKLKI